MSKGTEGLEEQTARAIYDVLVRTCEAPEDEREHFVHVQARERIAEWRFMGALGFGGKFWRSTGYRADGTLGERWYVNAYPENRTDERAAMIEAANAELWELQRAGATS